MFRKINTLKQRCTYGKLVKIDTCEIVIGKVTGDAAFVKVNSHASTCEEV